MTSPYRTITISTVGDLPDHAYRLHAHCRGCRQSKVVDLEAIARRVGRSRSYLNGSLRLRCACGNRDVAITIEAIKRDCSSRPKSPLDRRSLELACGPEATIVEFTIELPRDPVEAARPNRCLEGA